MEINLPDDVERLRPALVYERKAGGFEKVATMQPDTEGGYIDAYNVPVIQEQARQEEREKVREALAGVTARRSIHTREAGQVLPIESIEIALDSLDPDTPEGGSGA